MGQCVSAREEARAEPADPAAKQKRKRGLHAKHAGPALFEVECPCDPPTLYVDRRVDRTRKFRRFAVEKRLKVTYRHTGPLALTSSRTSAGSSRRASDGSSSLMRGNVLVEERAAVSFTAARRVTSSIEEWLHSVDTVVKEP